MSTLLLRCGCQVSFDPKGDYMTAPICGEHGPTAIVRVIGMPAPRIRGVATGPHVRTEDLPAHGTVLAGVSPLPSPAGGRRG